MRNTKAKSESTSGDTRVLRPPAEALYVSELETLMKGDKDARPPGWKLSPRSVRSFIWGSDKPKISRKFYGDDTLVERAVIGLASNRGLLLVGERARPNRCFPSYCPPPFPELRPMSYRAAPAPRNTASSTPGTLPCSWPKAQVERRWSPRAVQPGERHSRSSWVALPCRTFRRSTPQVGRGYCCRRSPPAMHERLPRLRRDTGPRHSRKMRSSIPK